VDGLDVITRFVLPPLLGGAAGLFTTWARWGVEKRRMRIQRRQQLLDRWRKELLAVEGGVKHDGGVNKYPFMRVPLYASLRPHLSKEFVEELERKGLRGIVGGESDFPRRELIEEIARIEKKWKLVWWPKTAKNHSGSLLAYKQSGGAST
jgi:hypothetical protein